MTRQEPSNDQKKGSADLRSTGEVAGMPGHNIADGLSPDALATSTSDRLAAQGEDVPKGGRAGATIPEQTGCGPSVTDYPGLSDDRRQ